ncbi:MAG: sporulation transcriptional regulator SpoIIID [Oscillospiraceae bacterium]|nr:sporulation transcriptional regulator SpoIIID [Oscillospiraceae bacterium]
MKDYIEDRAIALAHYIIENKATVRCAAGKFFVSKSTVHKDIAERLKVFDRKLYLEVKRVLDENKAERHLRGGMATRRKYLGEDAISEKNVPREKAFRK